MLRSLFIGFLILSTLSSKDIGAGTNQSFADIAADMLMEIFSASVSCTDSHQEVLCPDTDEIRQDKVSAYSSASGRFNIYTAIDENEAWLDNYRFGSQNDILLCNLTPLKEKIIIKEIISYGSGVSPPNNNPFF